MRLARIQCVRKFAPSMRLKACVITFVHAFPFTVVYLVETLLYALTHNMPAVGFLVAVLLLVSGRSKAKHVRWIPPETGD